MKILKKDELENGKWYLGIGRGSNVAYWDGVYFHYIELKFGHAVQKVADHWYSDGCFQPIERIVSEKYGRVGQYLEATE